MKRRIQVPVKYQDEAFVKIVNDLTLGGDKIAYK